MTKPSSLFPLPSSLLLNLILLLSGTALFFLTRQLISEYDHFTIGFSGVSGWSLVCYVVAVAAVLTLKPNRYTFPILLTVAIACRLVTLFPEPFLSSDVYRYAWDGVVQHAHINPFRYVPGDPALTFLRAPNQDLYDHINRRDYAVTIYPPVAQLLFFLITWINPEVTMMKLAMVLFEGATLWALVQLLRGFGLPRERTLIYAWCPLLIWEIAGSGHLDSAAMAFSLLALLARYRRHPVATGLFLALAVLTKLYPIVLFPALYRRTPAGKLDWKMPATMAVLIPVGYACYASVGMRVFGFLGGYVKEEGMDSGTRYFLLELAQRAVHVPAAAYILFVAAVFAGLSYWCWRTFSANVPSGTSLPELAPSRTFLLGAFALAFALMLLFSPHYPWYIAWLIPFVVLIPSLTVFTYICAFFYLCTTALATGTGAPQFHLNALLYSCTLGAFLIEVAWFKLGPRKVSSSNA